MWRVALSAASVVLLAGTCGTPHSEIYVVNQRPYDIVVEIDTRTATQPGRGQRDSSVVPAELEGFVWRGGDPLTGRITILRAQDCVYLGGGTFVDMRNSLIVTVPESGPTSLDQDARDFSERTVSRDLVGAGQSDCFVGFR